MRKNDNYMVLIVGYVYYNMVQLACGFSYVIAGCTLLQLYFFRFPNNRIPTLPEVITFAKENNLFLLLDVKGTVDEVWGYCLAGTHLSIDFLPLSLPPFPLFQSVPPLVSLFNQDPWLINNVAIISFFPDIIYNVSATMPVQ